MSRLPVNSCSAISIKTSNQKHNLVTATKHPKLFQHYCYGSHCQSLNLFNLQHLASTHKYLLSQMTFPLFAANCVCRFLNVCLEWPEYVRGHWNNGKLLAKIRRRIKIRKKKQTDRAKSKRRKTAKKPLSLPAVMSM